VRDRATTRRRLGIAPYPSSVARIAIARTDDWERVREIRLRALEDSPTAFAARLDQERDRPESFWRGRLEEEGSATFLAIEEETTVGLVTVFLMDEAPEEAHLVSMWVAPERRRHGLGRRLIEAVLSWARDQRAEGVRLWVTETNNDARRLYRSAGFIETGERQPLPSNPELRERELRRRV
jgi:ribosomal protein S18 acetylase RimI-like enzyme